MYMECARRGAVGKAADIKLPGTLAGALSGAQVVPKVPTCDAPGSRQVTLGIDFVPIGGLLLAARVGSRGKG